MTRRAKCIAEAGMLLPCGVLGECFEDHHNAQWNRLTLEEVRKFDEECKRVGMLAVLRTGDHRKHGVCLNVCPFCGTNLVPARPQKKVKP